MAEEVQAAPFEDGERVLVPQNNLLYEARVLKSRRNAKKGDRWECFIHYQGWNKMWDEWMPVTSLRKYVEGALTAGDGRRRPSTTGQRGKRKGRDAASAAEWGAGSAGLGDEAEGLGGPRLLGPSSRRVPGVALGAAGAAGAAAAAEAARWLRRHHPEAVVGLLTPAGGGRPAAAARRAAARRGSPPPLALALGRSPEHFAGVLRRLDEAAADDSAAPEAAPAFAAPGCAADVLRALQRALAALAQDADVAGRLSARVVLCLEVDWAAFNTTADAGAGAGDDPDGAASVAATAGEGLAEGLVDLRATLGATLGGGVVPAHVLLCGRGGRPPPGALAGVRRRLGRLQATATVVPAERRSERERAAFRAAVAGPAGFLARRFPPYRLRLQVGRLSCAVALHPNPLWVAGAAAVVGTTTLRRPATALRLDGFLEVGPTAAAAEARCAGPDPYVLTGVGDEDASAAGDAAAPDLLRLVLGHLAAGGGGGVVGLATLAEEPLPAASGAAANVDDGSGGGGGAQVYLVARVAGCGPDGEAAAALTLHVREAEGEAEGEGAPASARGALEGFGLAQSHWRAEAKAAGAEGGRPAAKKRRLAAERAASAPASTKPFSFVEVEEAVRDFTRFKAACRALTDPASHQGARSKVGEAKALFAKVARYASNFLYGDLRAMVGAAVREERGRAEAEVAEAERELQEKSSRGSATRTKKGREELRALAQAAQTHLAAATLLKEFEGRL